MVQPTYTNKRKKEKQHKTGNDVIERTPADPCDCVSRAMIFAFLENTNVVYINMLSLLISLNCYFFCADIVSKCLYKCKYAHNNNMDNFNGPFGACWALIITMNYH